MTGGVTDSSQFSRGCVTGSTVKSIRTRKAALKAAGQLAMKESSMKRFTVVAAVVLAAVMSVGEAAWAQGPRVGGPGGPGRAGGRGMFGALPLGSLNLTQAQQDLIRDIRERNREEVRQVEARLRTAQAAQQKAVSAIPLNEAAIRASTLAVAEVQADVAILQARAQNEIFSSLTAEQQASLKTALAEREQRVQARQAQPRERRQKAQQ
jgi:Spy/CpxP family protein refolding chaperone